jgi:hypothetical protein
MMLLFLLFSFRLQREDLGKHQNIAYESVRLMLCCRLAHWLDLIAASAARTEL